MLLEPKFCIFLYLTKQRKVRTASALAPNQTLYPMKALFIACFIALLHLPGFGQRPLVKIPIKFIDGLMFIELTLNDHEKPLSFLFDTGAAITVFDANVSKLAQIYFLILLLKPIMMPEKSGSTPLKTLSPESATQPTILSVWKQGTLVFH